MAGGRDPAAAASGYAIALAAAPASAVVAIRAYRAALASGDDALADRAAAVLAMRGVAPADAGLLAAGDAARRGDPAELRAAIDRLRDSTLSVLVPSLSAWAALAGGEDPLPVLTGAADPVSRRFAAADRALLLIARGQPAEGLTAVRAQTASDGRNLDLEVAAAQLLAGDGRRRDAEALLAGRDPALARIRAGIGRGREASAGFGVSRLFSRLLADLGDDAPEALGIALGRAALRADPADDRARVLLAGVLARHDAADAALTLLDAVDRRGPWIVAAEAQRVAVLVEGDRSDDALAAARTLAERRGAGAIDWRRYADRLADAARWNEAAAWYARVAEAHPRQWRAWLQLGAALEPAGRWPEAKAALERARALVPDEPVVMNELGYLSLVHGEPTAAAQALLAEAHRLQPEDAAITDSLAWSYVVAGDVRRAVPLLEQAQRAAPGDGDIGEHLGDAYWRVGRRYEARHAWRAAAIDAEAGDQARLGLKILHGWPPQR